MTKTEAKRLAAWLVAVFEALPVDPKACRHARIEATDMFCQDCGVKLLAVSARA